jgi:hypothetical protein
MLSFYRTVTAKVLSFRNRREKEDRIGEASRSENEPYPFSINLIFLTYLLTYSRVFTDREGPWPPPPAFSILACPGRWSANLVGFQRIREIPWHHLPMCFLGVQQVEGWSIVGRGLEYCRFIFLTRR